MVTSFFRITSLQVIKEKLYLMTDSLDFYVDVYPCCLTAWYKHNSKVVFILFLLYGIPRERSFYHENERNEQLKKVGTCPSLGRINFIKRRSLIWCTVPVYLEFTVRNTLFSTFFIRCQFKSVFKPALQEIFHIFY